MQAPLLAAEEIKRLTTELRMPGIQIGSHIGDWNLDSRQLDPVWKVSSGTSGLFSSNIGLTLQGHHVYVSTRLAERITMMFELCR